MKGPGAGDWLDRIVANKVPREDGRMCLTPMLGKRGGIVGDFTIARLDEDHYLIVGSGMAERYHKRYFDTVLKPQGVRMISRTDAWGGFNVAGPKARELLGRLTNTDLGNDGFKFMRARRTTVAGIDTVALRVSFTGDLGWELHVEEDQQLALFDALMEAGADLDVRPVGSRALLSMRVEKGYGSWGREYSPEYWPQEVGLDRLIKLDKPEFLGREAYLKLKDRPPRETMVLLEVEATIADASGGEPIFDSSGAPVGRVSSGTYGFTVDRSLAIGFIAADKVDHGETFDVAILGQRHDARVLPEPPFDPKGMRLRA